MTSCCLEPGWRDNEDLDVEYLGLPKDGRVVVWRAGLSKPQIEDAVAASMIYAIAEFLLASFNSMASVPRAFNHLAQEVNLAHFCSERPSSALGDIPYLALWTNLLSPIYVHHGTICAVQEQPKHTLEGASLARMFSHQLCELTRQHQLCYFFWFLLSRIWL